MSSFFRIYLFFTSIFGLDLSYDVRSSLWKFWLWLWAKWIISTKIIFLIVVLVDIVIYLKIIWRFCLVSSLILPILFICSILFYSLLFRSLLFILWQRISIFWFWSLQFISLKLWYFIFTLAFAHILSTLCTLSLRWKFDDFLQILIIVLNSFNNRMSFLVDFRNLLLRFFIILSLLLFYNLGIE